MSEDRVVVATPGITVSLRLLLYWQQYRVSVDGVKGVLEVDLKWKGPPCTASNGELFV